MGDRKPYEYNVGRLATKFTAEQRLEVFKRDFDPTINGVRCADPRCTLPITEKDLPYMDLHHDKIQPGQPGSNYLENKRVAHHICNARLGRPIAPSSVPNRGREKEEEAATPRPIPELASAKWASQSEKSPQMVEAWDRWIASKEPWLAKEEIPLDILIHTAPTALGSWVGEGEDRRLVKLGTAETYRKYAMTDAASGRLHMEKRGGQWWVSYIGELMEGMTRQQLAARRSLA